MIALPFIFFGTWAIRAFKNNGLSILTLILSFYAISAFFSILIEVNGFYAANSCPKTELGILAPILYCMLITMCIKPFAKIRNICITPLSNKAEKLLVLISALYCIVFVIVLCVAWDRMLFVLAAGDQIAEIRNEQYTGDAVSFYDHTSGLIRYVCAICATLSQSSFLMLLVFGYMIAYSKMKVIYKILPLVGSFTPFIISINIADRSQFVYWIIMLMFSLTVFHKNFNKKTKNVIIILVSCIIFFLLSYIMAVTTSRFAFRDGGVKGGLILYAGQSYINFCRFINDIQPPLFSLNVVFPSITHYIFHGDGYFDIVNKVGQMNGNAPLAVFPTFLGIIYSTCGPIVLFLFLVAYRLMANFVCGLFKRVQSFSSLIYLWIVALVPTLGFIGYFYMGYNTAIMVIVWLIIAKIVNK